MNLINMNKTKPNLRCHIKKIVQTCFELNNVLIKFPFNKIKTSKNWLKSGTLLYIHTIMYVYMVLFNHYHEDRILIRRYMYMDLYLYLNRSHTTNFQED